MVAAGEAAGAGDGSAIASGTRSGRRKRPGKLPARPAVRGPDGAMTLAKAFQLMSQALTELRGPVTQDALRLRMAALHGRDDALLDATRFPRLLRQANDAEIADVRKVGEDDYEISLHRSAALAAANAPSTPRAEAAPPSPEPEAAAQPEPSGTGGGAGRDNGSRFGVRFRRGSRGSSRPGEIPLIGVVQMEVAPDEPPAAEVPLGRSGRGGPGEEAGSNPARAPKEGRQGRGHHRSPRGSGGRGTSQAPSSSSQEEAGVTITRRAATLPVSFFERPAEPVARELLGALVVSTIGGRPTTGRIVETEAYLGRDDPASHGYQDRRHAQNESLYGPPGSCTSTSRTACTGAPTSCVVRRDMRAPCCSGR